MDFEKLESLARTPRVIDERLEKIHTKPFFFLKDAVRAWERGMTHGPLVYGFVVQANVVLFDPEEAQLAPAVLLCSEDPRVCRDIEWISDLGIRIAELRETGSSDPAEQQLADLLNDEESDFDVAIPHSLTGGVDCNMWVTYISPDELPNGYIAEHRIIPLLVLEPGNRLIVPGELYA